MRPTALLLCFLNFFSQKHFAQKPTSISLTNPSFEGKSDYAAVPLGWFDSGNSNESPPDTQPNCFGVTTPAKNGGTYLGLVVRDNNTTEGVGQVLKTPLLKGITYQFSLWACRSQTYLSESPTTGKDDPFNVPVILEIWGNTLSNKPEKLAQTLPISNAEWQEFALEWTPKSELTHFFIKAFYTRSVSYNGNVLVDNLSPIKPKIEAIALQEKAIKTKKQATKIKEQQMAVIKTGSNENIKIDPSVNPLIPPTLPTQPLVVVQESAPNAPKKGQIFKIENLQFRPNEAVIEEKSKPSLKKQVDFLKNNPKLKVEIGGHTNMVVDYSIAESLSKSRAQAVANFLIQEGIDARQLTVRGYGKSKPIENSTERSANERNQRVEIKILDTE